MKHLITKAHSANSSFNPKQGGLPRSFPIAGKWNQRPFPVPCLRGFFCCLFPARLSISYAGICFAQFASGFGAFWRSHWVPATHRSLLAEYPGYRAAFCFWYWGWTFWKASYTGYGLPCELFLPHNPRDLSVLASDQALHPNIRKSVNELFVRQFIEMQGYFSYDLFSSITDSKKPLKYISDFSTLCLIFLNFIDWENR